MQRTNKKTPRSWRTFRSREVDNVSISLEHVDLLNCLDRLNVQLLQGRLQLLVIHSCALVDLLDLSSRRAFSTVADVSLIQTTS